MSMPHGDIDSGPGHTLVIGTCANDGFTFTFNPHTVISVPIDPLTALPPDVNRFGKNITPDPAAIARAVKQPVCNDCARKAGIASVRLPKESSR